MYSELLLFPRSLENQCIQPDAARSIVGKACAHFPVDPRVFSRGPDGQPLNATFEPDASGRALPKPPLVSFGGGNGFIRLVGYGSEGVKVLQDNATMIGTAVGQSLQSPFRFRFNEGHCQVSPLLGFVRSYFIPMLALTKKDRDFNRIGPRDQRITLDQLVPMIRQCITSGLISQARYMDESYFEVQTPELARLESAIGTDDALNIEVFEGAPVFRSINADSKGKVLFVKGLRFTMALDLEGPWTCGVLRSRGFGRILKAFK